MRARKIRKAAKKHRELHAKRGKRAGKTKETAVPAPPINMLGDFKRLTRPYKPSWKTAPPPPPGAAPLVVEGGPVPPPPGILKPFKRRHMGLRAPGQLRRMRVAQFGGGKSSAHSDQHKMQNPLQESM